MSGALRYGGWAVVRRVTGNWCPTYSNRNLLLIYLLTYLIYYILHTLRLFRVFLIVLQGVEKQLLY